MSRAIRGGKSDSARHGILVVSPDAQRREHLYDVLSRRGEWLVTTAASFENGLERLQQGERVDVIVFESVANRAKNAEFLDRVRYFDERLPILLLEPPDDTPADTSMIRRVQAVLPGDATDQALLAAVVRWLSSQRPAKPLRFPGQILIVDDEPDLIKSVAEFLQSRGCTVLAASSGEDALAQVAKHRPTLVLLDIKMRGMDGLVTLKKLKALRPEVPVIMATAVEDEALMEQASVLGAYDYILKPYNLAALEALLASLKKRAGAALASHAS